MVWWTGTSPGWVRFDLGARYRVLRFEEQPWDLYKDVRIYCTDVDSSDRADWGAPVATIQFTQWQPVRQTVDFIGYGRYVIFDARTSWSGVYAMWEAWIYATPAPLQTPPVSMRAPTLRSTRRNAHADRRVE